MNKNAHLQYRPDIDGLRAVAIVSVIMFHFFPGTLQGGFVGVDVFFVISGFLISGIIFKGIKQKSFSFKEFYIKRIKRIFPALIFVMSLSIIAGWFILLPNEYEQLGKHAAGGAGFIANFIFAKEYGYFDALTEHKILIHLWSLGIEEQFYFIWPLIIFYCAKRKMNLLNVIISIAVLSFLYNVLRVENHPKSTFYHPFGRFWELLAGSFLAYLNHYIYKGSSRSNAILDNIKSVLGSLLLAISFITLNKVLSFPGWWAIFPVAGSALIIAAGPKAWINRHILANRLCVFIGLISYPLYLWHWPLLSFTRITHIAPLEPTIKLILILTAAILAYLTYRFIETPVRTSKDKNIHNPLICSMLVVFFISLAAYIFHGYPKRFPRSIQYLTSFQYLPLDSWRSETCFLEKNDDTTESATICAGDKTRHGKKLFLWGDSHAAQYYPALLKYKKDFDIVQYTAATCPPVLGFHITVRPYCTYINNQIIKKIRKTKPDIVMLSAYWFGYSGKEGGFDKLDVSQLGATIKQLKQISIKKIILVGPSIEWDLALPTLLMRYSRDHGWSKPPERMYYGLNKKIVKSDMEMQALALDLGIIYVSPVKTLCDVNGCLTQSSGVPITGDTSHLTTEGAAIILKLNIDKIIN